MKAGVLAGLALMAAAPVFAADEVVTPEGWYRVEEGSGETEDSMAAVVVEATPAQAQPSPPAAPDLRAEIEEFLKVDCEAARGRYLHRVLQLHGVNVFALEPELLAVWTYRRPPPGGAGWPFPAGVAGDPALAPLYGEAPVPPGALSFDLELQTLARDLLHCQAQAARDSARPQSSGGSGLDQRSAPPESL